MIAQTPDEVSKQSGEQPSVPQAPISRGLLTVLAAPVLLLGLVVFRGIHQRALAENNLGAVTERAAVATVNVVHPKSGAGAEEIVLPGTTQPFNDTPIYARTN